VWAEDSDLGVKSPSQALRSARPHPFATPAEALVQSYSGKPDEVTLLLPSLRTAPLDSPRLLRAVPRPEPRSAPALLPWRVPVVTLDATTALEVLAEPVNGIRRGASLDFLTELARFARGLIARGRVLPTLERDEIGPSARWRPVLHGQDVIALHNLATAMPPVCRALPGHDDPTALTVTGRAGSSTRRSANASRPVCDSPPRAPDAARADCRPPRRGWARSRRHTAVSTPMSTS
jgi:hypothetical protein